MKSLSFIILFISFTQVLLSQDTTRVLFIGNSITYYNDMPQTFEDISNSLDDTTKVTMYAPGGTGFANHVADNNVYNLFRQANWDNIVLQPGTGDSGGAEVGGTPIETTLTRIRTLLDSIYFYNPCVQVLFNEISNGVYSSSAADLLTYNNSMDLIFSNTEYFSDSTNLPMAPVGEVFRTQWNNNLDNLLWVSNGNIHPNEKGSYIAACTIYATIFNKPSEGSLVINNLDPDEATHFQHISDSIVLQHMPNWNIGTFIPISNFDYQTNIDTIFFNSLSQNIDSLVWDFGDGTNSILSNPSHIYANNGNYNVVLTSYKNGCSYPTETILPYSSNTIETHKPNNSITIWPNPSKDILNIKYNSSSPNTTFLIYNNLGQLVIESSETKIDITSLNKGIYVLKVFNPDSDFHKSMNWIKI